MPLRQLAYNFRISKSTVATIVIQTCQAIWEKLVEMHIPEPTEADIK